MRTLFDLFDEAGRGPSKDVLASAGEPFAEEIMAEVRGTTPAAGGGEVPPVVTQWSDKCLSLLSSDERSFCSQVFALLKEIPDLEDQTLENFMSSVSMAERRLFLLRGACAFERIERVAEWVPGKPVVTKKKQTGKTKLIAEMAGAIGVSAKLLARDVQIVSTFFPEGQPILARENLLAREYYVTALAAPDPIDALGTAVERGAPADFSRAEFRLWSRSTDWNTWFRPGAVTALFAVLLVAAFLIVRTRVTTPTVSAAELLRRSATAEETAASNVDQALHRTITLEERKVTGEVIARRRIEIWHSGGRGVTARRLYDERGALLAGDWRRSDGGQTIYHHGAQPQIKPLPEGRDRTPVSFADAWQLSPSAKEFTALIVSPNDARVEEKATSYAISYVSDAAGDTSEL